MACRVWALFVISPPRENFVKLVIVCIENNGVASVVKCEFVKKLGQNLSDMEGMTLVRIQKVIWDHLLASKAEIIER